MSQTDDIDNESFSGLRFNTIKGVCCYFIFRRSHLPGVDVGRLDGVEEQLGHAHALHVDQVGLEQRLRGLEPLPPHLDHPAVRELRGRGGLRVQRSKVGTRGAGPGRAWSGQYP